MTSVTSRFRLVCLVFIFLFCTFSSRSASFTSVYHPVARSRGFIATTSVRSVVSKASARPDLSKVSTGSSFSKATVRSVHSRSSARRAELRAIAVEAAGLFAEMQLQDSGLNEKALEYALLGYHRLLRRHVLHRTDVLSICDFSQSSGSKRMYVIDVRNRKLLYRTYVAHGNRSGSAYARSFSNRPESHKSSLGFYVTRKTYFGCNGLSLRIDGVDKGFNTMAKERNIVIHGAPYVSERILHKYGVMGTTFGCPAIPEEMSKQIIPVLKNGSCFFIYYPSKRYLAASSVLNG